RARDRRELLLSKARRLAERPELRGKGPRSARFHGAFILPLQPCGRRSGPVRPLWVVVASPALHTGQMAAYVGDAPNPSARFGHCRVLARPLPAHLDPFSPSGAD